MGQYKIDNRNREDIINQIMSMAAYYAPDWRFNPDEPDSGAALSLIWADMFSDTLQKYNRILEQNKIAFYNAFGAELKPAVGAEGFLSFELTSQEKSGAYIDKDTEVFASLPDAEPVYFTTKTGIFVTPAHMQDIICTLPDDDKIIHSWNAEVVEKTVLLDKNGLNLQTHYIYIGHNEVFNVNADGYIYVKFNLAGSYKLPVALMASGVLWEYSSEEGYVPFKKISPIENGVILQFDEDALPIYQYNAFDSEESFRFIRLSLLEPEKFENVTFSKANIYSQNLSLPPTVVYSGDLEQSGYGFYPFGERFSLYRDLYIACDEALEKFGAEIELTFDLRFHAIEIGEKWEKDINWKMVMKKRDFDKDTIYHISLKRAVWEYFNGKGWATLPVTGFSHEKIFHSLKSDDNAIRCRINFICPDDMSDILINAGEKKYIRIRVLETENAYRTNGYYITPWIENMAFKYHYPEKDILPKALITHCNGEIEYFNEKTLMKEEAIPFFPKKYNNPAVYFRYDTAPIGAPVRTLFHMAVEYENDFPVLVWEYYSRGGWQKLTVYDETYNFRKSGIITFLGNSDFAPHSLFGIDGYWIRCIDIKGEYGQNRGVVLPIIEKFYPNTVRITNKRHREEEFFSVEINEANKTCQLSYPCISDIECFVLEKNPLNQEGDNGDISAKWVLWQEVESFMFSEAESRHYTIDRENAIVTFGNGVYGKIPDYNLEGNSIKTVYSTNDGESSNLGAGLIDRFSQTNHFISRLFNPLPTVGGYDTESPAAAMKRSADNLTHLFKAVTAGDYEALAHQASLNVCKCKCFTNTDKHEKHVDGYITLVVLQKDYAYGGDYFSELKNKLKAFILERNALPLTVKDKFEIVEPRFIRMNVKVYLSAESMDNVFYIQQEVTERINRFLDPVKGNFSAAGWEIGRIPNATQINNYIKSIPHIKSIEKIVITYYTKLQRGYSEVDLDHIGIYKFMLPESGHHEVYVNLV